MKLLRQQMRKAVGYDGATPAAAEAQAHPGVARVLKRVLAKDKPEILDLGPICGHTVVYLADRGARVSVEEFEPPPPAVEAQPDASDEAEAPPPIRLEQEDGKFDLVLAWEQCDFVPPKRLAEFAAELRRVMAVGGSLLLFSRNVNVIAKERKDVVEVPCRYRLVSDGEAVREPAERPQRRRWVHPTREIERALAPLSVEGIHLQRNQMREFSALKGRK